MHRKLHDIHIRNPALWTLYFIEVLTPSTLNKGEKPRRHILAIPGMVSAVLMGIKITKHGFIQKICTYLRTKMSIS